MLVLILPLYIRPHAVRNYIKEKYRAQMPNFLLIIILLYIYGKRVLKKNLLLYMIKQGIDEVIKKKKLRSDMPLKKSNRKNRESFIIIFIQNFIYDT